MAYYIKARPKVAEELGLKGLCAKTADGNILLWQADMQKTGYMVLSDAVASVGGVLLTSEQARAERRGEQKMELPIPTDPRFMDSPIPTSANEESASANDVEPTTNDVAPNSVNDEPTEEAKE